MMRGRRQRGGVSECTRRLRRVTAWAVWVGVACMSVAGQSASAQDELTGNDPAAWLAEASVQARRITGVGEQLTEALQTKGAILAHVAAAQHAMGDAAPATQNQKIVSLCLRALSHDGEDGWVLAAQAHAQLEQGLTAEAEQSINRITRPAEQSAVRAWLKLNDDKPATSTDAQVGLRFASQRDWFDHFQTVRREAAKVARFGSVRDAQVWVGVLSDPAERAWASLGVAEGLRDAAAAPRPKVVPDEAAPQPAPPEPNHPAEPLPDATPTTATPVPETADKSEPTPESEIVSEAAAEPEPANGTEPAPEAVAEASNPGVVAAEDAVTLDMVPEALPTHAEVAADTAAPQGDAAERPDAAVPPTPAAEALAETPPAPAPAPAVIIPEPSADASEIPVLPDLQTLADPALVLDDAPAAPTFDLEFTTTKGSFVVRVHRDWAPRAADRFYDLAVSGFYHNQRFFRVVQGFVVQWGIHGYPEVAAAWRKQTMPDEPRTQPNRRGTIAFAAAKQPGTRTTQVFINLTDNAFLDDLDFVPFGEIVEGLDVVESLFGGYGETPSEQQREIQLQGNVFLDQHYPKLDSIIAVEIRE